MASGVGGGTSEHADSVSGAGDPGGSGGKALVGSGGALFGETGVGGVDLSSVSTSAVPISSDFLRRLFFFFFFFFIFFLTAAFPARDGTGGLSGGDSERLGGGRGGARFGEAEAAAGATFSPTSEGVSPSVL